MIPIENKFHTHFKNKLYIAVVIEGVHVYFLSGFNLHFVIDARHTDVDYEG